jgi:hypothetical protein
VHHEQGHCHDAPSISPKFRSSLTNSLTWPCQYFQITMLVYCLTLFKKLKVNNALVIKKTN